MLHLLLLAVAFQVCFGAAPVVDTKFGKIAGTENNNSYAYFGIPYAKPPTGTLRWTPPVDPKAWTPGVYSATAVKPGCPQYKCDKLSPPMVCPKLTAEDCLYLNVWTPLGSNATSSLAVMVYIHGGNFVHMSGGSPLFDSRFLSQKGNVIVVTFNYRLGALGFLVTGNTENDALGNYGILDQRLAMKWVHDNIKAFGGDPNKVTLFGQSAGAQSTLIHLANAESAIYFRNSIVESSPLSIPYKSYAEAVVIGAHWAKLLNCTPRDMTCLRKRSPVDIAYAQFLARSKVSSVKLLEFFEPWGPWVDGTIVNAEPVKAMEKGWFQRKPVMLGTTSEETRLYIYSAWDKPMDNVLYDALVTASDPVHALEILFEYPPDSPPDERTNMVSLSTDWIFGCANRHVTREIVKYGIATVYLYIYDHAFSFPGWGNLTFCQGYVCHGSEIPMVFQTAGFAGFKYTPEELVLSDEVIAYWTNFAKYNDPNGIEPSKNLKAGPKWQLFHSENQWPYLHFKTPSSFTDTNYNGPFCDFWDRIGYNN